MLPVVKGVGSEQAYAKLTPKVNPGWDPASCGDYPIEQYIRDAVDSAEGTTAIQAQALLFRKIVRDKGVALARVRPDPEFVDKAVLATAAEDRTRAAGQRAHRRPGHGGRTGPVT